MKQLTYAQLEDLADRFLTTGGADLDDLPADSAAARLARSLRRRQRGSQIIGAGRCGSDQSARQLTADLPPARPVEWDDEQEDEQEDFIQDQEVQEEQAAGGVRELLDDFRALLDTHRLATRDRCTPRMAQIAAARQRDLLARMGDLLGFDDFHSLHQALYSLPRARRDRAPRRAAGGQQQRQAALWGAES